MNRVLADTGPLYALVDPDDRHHERARQQVGRLLALDFEMVVLQPILLEAHTLILRKLGTAIAHIWLREISAGVALLNPTAADYEDARDRAEGYADQAITLFDSTLATLSERLEIPVWTYDFYFDVMRIAVWREP